MTTKNELAAKIADHIDAAHEMHFQMTESKWIECCGEEAGKDAFATFTRDNARNLKLLLAGLLITTRRKLVKLSNARFVGGRLQDGTCHYEYQSVIEGETWQHRAMLKSIGARWDAGDKVWYVPMSPSVGNGSQADNMDDVRNRVASQLAG